jgi:anti-sigma B factor antagonist
LLAVSLLSDNILESETDRRKTMELELESKKEGNELTIKLSGEINTGTAPQLKELLDAEIADSDVITLDFEKCDFVSSAGLRALLSTFKALKAKKGQMKLVNIGPNFKEVLNITGLDVVFGCR